MIFKVTQREQVLQGVNRGSLKAGFHGEIQLGNVKVKRSPRRHYLGDVHCDSLKGGHGMLCFPKLFDHGALLGNSHRACIQRKKKNTSGNTGWRRKWRGVGIHSTTLPSD